MCDTFNLLVVNCWLNNWNSVFWKNQLTFVLRYISNNSKAIQIKLATVVALKLQITHWMITAKLWTLSSVQQLRLCKQHMTNTHSRAMAVVHVFVHRIFKTGMLQPRPASNDLFTVCAQSVLLLLLRMPLVNSATLYQSRWRTGPATPILASRQSLKSSFCTPFLASIAIFCSLWDWDTGCWVAEEKVKWSPEFSVLAAMCAGVLSCWNSQLCH